MKRSYIILIAVILVPCLLMLLNNGGITAKIEDNIVFKEKLSEYGLFEGNISDLNPCDGAFIMEIASSLFTDYAEKHRIILLPNGQKLKSNGDELPDFPDGTIIAKTFFYPNRRTGDLVTRSILETRLLIKNNSQWNAATYQWNGTQDEAFLLQDGATLPVVFEDKKGNSRTIDYKIPSRADCISCHRQSDKILPIGPKLRNMNIDVIREERTINQLAYLKEQDKLDIASIDEIEPTIDYRDESQPIEERARAYLDINCAHCHRPNGIAGITQLDLRYDTPIIETGIWLKHGKIAARMTAHGEMRMPQKGTTILHEEGLQLVLDYIQNLDSKNN